MKKREFKHKQGYIATSYKGHMYNIQPGDYTIPAIMVENSSDWKEVESKPEKPQNRFGIYEELINHYQTEIILSKFDGLCDAFKEIGYNIADFPEIMEQKPSGAHEAAFWFPGKLGTEEFRKARVEVLERAIEMLKPKKDYEILALYPTKEGEFNIESVKRLSDGEVFSVGYEDEFAGEVRRFVETSKGLYAECRDYDVRINLLTKSKLKPKKDYKVGKKANPELLYFSTSEAAEFYRLYHARKLSPKDLDDNTDISERYFEGLLNLVKSRL